MRSCRLIFYEVSNHMYLSEFKIFITFLHYILFHVISMNNLYEHCEINKLKLNIIEICHDLDAAERQVINYYNNFYSV